MEDASKGIGAINASIPKELTRGIMRKETDSSQEAVARKVYDSGGLSQEQKAKLRTAIDRGDFVHRSESVDKSVTSKIEKYVEGRMKAQIENGTIKRASEDGFIRKMRGRMS